MLSYLKTNKTLRQQLALSEAANELLKEQYDRAVARNGKLAAEIMRLNEKVDHASKNAKIHEALALAEQESKFKATRVVQGVKKPSGSPVAPTLRSRYTSPSPSPSPAPMASPPTDNSYWNGVLTGVVVNEIFSSPSPSPAPASSYSSGGGGDYGGGGASGSWDSSSSSSSSSD